MDKSRFKNFFNKQLRRKKKLIFSERPILYENIFHLNIDNIYNLHILHYLYQFNLFRGKIIKILLDGQSEKINYKIVKNFIKNHKLFDMFILNLIEVFSVKVEDISIFFEHQYENKIIKMIRKNKLRLIFNYQDFIIPFNSTSELIYDIYINTLPDDKYKYLEILLRNFNLPPNFPNHPISVFFVENKQLYLNHPSPLIVIYSLKLLSIDEILNYILDNKIRIDKNEFQDMILRDKLLKNIDFEKLDLILKSEYLEMRIFAVKIIKKLFGNKIPEKYSHYISNNHNREIREIFQTENYIIDNNLTLENNICRLISSFSLREINHLFKIIKVQIQKDYNILSMKYFIEIFNKTINRENITFHKSRAIGYIWFIRAICEERFPRFDLYTYLFTSINNNRYPYIMFNILKFLVHNHYFDFILNEKYLLDICFQYFSKYKFIIGEILGYVGMQLFYFSSSYFNYMIDDESTFIILSFIDIYIDRLNIYERNNLNEFYKDILKYEYKGNCFIERKYKNILKKIHGYLSSNTEYRSYVEGEEDKRNTPIHQ